MALSFTTSRLTVSEITSDYLLTDLSQQVQQILIPDVVENLPPYFHGIDSDQSAHSWLERMLSDSRLLLVKLRQGTLIGFLFAYVEKDSEAHIGYLLAKEYWGKGLASELVQGLIEEVAQTERWHKLIGGVDKSNLASAKLLNKIGFVAQPDGGNQVLFFEYTIDRTA